MIPFLLFLVLTYLGPRLLYVHKRCKNTRIKPRMRGMLLFEAHIRKVQYKHWKDVDDVELINIPLKIKADTNMSPQSA